MSLRKYITACLFVIAFFGIFFPKSILADEYEKVICGSAGMTIIKATNITDSCGDIELTMTITSTPSFVDGDPTVFVAEDYPLFSGKTTIASGENKTFVISFNVNINEIVCEENSNYFEYTLESSTNHVFDTSNYSQSPWTKGQSNKILVAQSFFTASVSKKRIIIERTIESENDILQFEILRCESENGECESENGECESENGYTSIITEKDFPVGNYSFMDDDVDTGHTYYYKLKDTDSNDKITCHGPVSAIFFPIPPIPPAPVFRLRLID